VTEGVTRANVPTVEEYRAYGSSVTLRWGENNNPSVTSYEQELYMGSGDRVSVSPELIGLNEVKFGGLTANTTYYVKVRALNLVGKETVWVDGEKKATDAAEPETVVLTAGGDPMREMKVEWGANGNPGDTDYRVWVAESLDVESRPIGGYPRLVRGTEHGVSGLTPNRMYWVRVDALGHNKKVALSDVKAHRTTEAGVNGVSLVVDGDGTTGLKYTWDTSANSLETLYEVELGEEATFSGVVHRYESVVGENSHVFGLLRSNRVYYARARAKGAVGFGGSVMSGYTRPTAVGLNVRPMDPVGDERHSVAFEWDHGTNDPSVTVYRVEVSSGENAGDHVVLTDVTNVGKNKLTGAEES
jgi:hypothetical protein